METNPRELAKELEREMNVPDLRDLCAEHDVNRERGADKGQTALAVAMQAPEAAAEAVDVELEEPGYVLVCPCGLEEEFDYPDDAAEAAESHLLECKRGLAVPGLGGLNIWSEETGARCWVAGEGDDPTALRV